MKYASVIILALAAVSAQAEETTHTAESSSTLTKYWFVDAGMDMSLQNPYSFDFSKVFPNGKSFGIDVAVGKWFSPQLGLRARLNWENGISLFENHHLNWLAPFNQPGVNMDRGGYLSVVGDLMFNLHTLLSVREEPRRWNLLLFPRFGLVYNYGGKKGSPLIGAGIENTYRLSNHWHIYCDMAYNGVSSGFTHNREAFTGVGDGSNMYFDLDLGVRYSIGESVYNHHFSSSLLHGDYQKLWSNWYVQMGAGLTLLNSCTHDFSNVLDKGRAYGIEVAMGKWFTPEIGVRGRLNWVNGLIRSSGLEWMAYKEPDKDNYDGGGCLLLDLDAMISLKSFLMGRGKGDKWDMYFLTRMGLGRNISLNSLSPLVGFGFGTTRRLTSHWGLYAETVYQGITSEFFSGVQKVNTTGTQFNGIWDFDCGVIYYLGQ